MFYESPIIPEMIMQQEKKVEEKFPIWNTGLSSQENERRILEKQQKSPFFQKISEKKLATKAKREINGPSE